MFHAVIGFCLLVTVLALFPKQTLQLIALIGIGAVILFTVALIASFNH